VLVNGELALYVERGGHSALSFVSGTALSLAAEALADAINSGMLVGGLRLAKLNGQDALLAHRDLAELSNALLSAGFSVTPRGLRLVASGRVRHAGR
jgi:ATP-dependent Lhr-like helicase